MVMSEVKEHPIAVAARRTGLSAHTIRKWEERYRAVAPERSPGGHRLYSEGDIERLQLLKRALRTGRRIGDIAVLPDDRLREFIRADVARPTAGAAGAAGAAGVVGGGAARSREAGTGPQAEEWIAGYLDAARRMDEGALRALLDRAAVELGQNLVVDSLIPDLMRAVGDAWQQGGLRVVHEHLTTTVVRSWLTRILEAAVLPESAPAAVAGTLPEQRHDLGALAAAVAAAASGWHAVYIGADTPPEEMAAAAASLGARAVLLSFSYPGDQQRVLADLTALKSYLPNKVEIFIGGEGAQDLVDGPLPEGVTVISDFAALRQALRALSCG